jgi:hypothetical protein
MEASGCQSGNPAQQFIRIYLALAASAQRLLSSGLRLATVAWRQEMRPVAKDSQRTRRVGQVSEVDADFLSVGVAGLF